MGQPVIAEWTVDGFLHPPATLIHAFVDVDDFLRVPLVGLADIVHFAVVTVKGVAVLVFDAPSIGSNPVLQNALQDRYSGASRVFISTASPGLVVVQGDNTSEIGAFAVAVTRFRCAWDESAEIKVTDARRTYFVSVTYQDDRYFLSARAS
jgi:hypothetical protein